MKKYILLSLYFIIAQSFGSESQDPNLFHNSYSQTVYGGVGNIYTPTARFHEDGELLFGISSEAPYNRLFATMQFFPWLEATVRYTEGQFTDYNPGSQQTWKDKGFDLKFRLFREGIIIPEIALGLGDVGGQGVFGREFLVASKRFNNVDLTLGLGWGKYAGVDHINNPRGWFDDSYELREFGASTGGRLEVGRFFTGENASFFGGIEYTTPIPNLTFKLEYDTTDYSLESGKPKHFRKESDIFTIDSRFNAALNYLIKPTKNDNIDLSLGFIRGNTIYANVALHSNLNFVPKPKIVPPAEILNQPYLRPFNQLDSQWQKYLTDLIMWQMANEGLVTHNLIFNGDEVQAEISQGRFQKPTLALELAARVLGNNSPTNIRRITVINMDMGIETLRMSIPRETLVNAVLKGPLDEELMEFNIYDKIDADAIVRKNEFLYPHFSWSLRPHALGTLQHQARFYFWQIEAILHAEYAIKKGFYLSADYGFDIANNYEAYDYHIPDGALHHVRQDRRLYLTEGKSGLRRMQFDYLWDIHPDLKVLASAGILEWMFGGIGGEVVYMPHGKHFALGLDAWWLKQREYDQKFSFRDFETVTSMLSFYYDLPFYNMRTKVSVGKYLGEDKGATIDISRRFKSGARVGGIVAFTDCNPACVGEGSFNKWIYFTLPMDLISQNNSSRATSTFKWSPLTKDAGQRVAAGGLYDMMRNAPDEVDTLRRKNWSIRKIFSGFSTTPKKTK